MPIIRSRRLVPPDGGMWFGWSVLLLAIGIAIAVLLLARQAHGAPLSLEDWTQQAIRRLPTYYEDAPPKGSTERTAAKEAQLSAIAHEVARLARKAPLPPRQWAALLLTIGFHESTFSLRIHAGDCRPKECDRGRARGPWQTHQNAFNREAWPKLQGIEHTDAQAGAADQLLRRVVRTCPDEPGWATVRGILTAYAGRRCYQDWPGLKERLATFGRLNP